MHISFPAALSLAKTGKACVHIQQDLEACKVELQPVASSCLYPNSMLAGMAMLKTVASLGSFVGPSVIGWAADHLHSYTPALLLLAVSLTVASVLHLTLPEPGET